MGSMETALPPLWGATLFLPLVPSSTGEGGRPPHRGSLGPFLRPAPAWALLLLMSSMGTLAPHEPKGRALSEA